MPKSKRARVVHLTQVQKKGREHKDKLFENVRAAVPEYRHCFVFRIDNSRNTHLKTVRQELTDCKYAFTPIGPCEREGSMRRVAVKSCS